MKRITKIILSLMVVLCIALYTMGANAQATGIGISQQDMSLTVSADVPEEDGTICYDLYRIAEISDDGFAFQVTDKFSELEGELSKASTTSDSGNAPDWRPLAQKAFALAVGEEGTVVEGTVVNEPSGADYTGEPLNKGNTVSKGLYLLVARETQNDKSVVKSVSARNADGGNNYADAQYAVSITAGTNVYTILPQIVCVPTKISLDGSKVVSTAEEGTWIYDQQIALNMDVAPASGAIQITKTLDGYTGDEKVVCVFQVDAYYPGNTQYSSEVYSVAFDGSGSKKSLTIGGLPIGATVDVKEVYSGANYTLSTSSSVSLEVTGGVPAEAAFTNERDNDRTGGGVTNHFTYQVNGGEGSWNWTTPVDNMQTVNGNSDTVLTQDSGSDGTGVNDTNG